MIYMDSGFPGSSDGKASACNVADPGSIPGLGRSPGEGNGKLDMTEWLHFFPNFHCIKNSSVNEVNICTHIEYINSKNKSQSRIAG